MLSELEKRESDYTRLQRQRMSSEDFEPLNIIGRGAFGEVGAEPGHAQTRLNTHAHTHVHTCMHTRAHTHTHTHTHKLPHCTPSP